MSCLFFSKNNSFSKMSLRETITIPFVIYAGLIFFINGIFGNLLNVFVFYKIDLKNPSTYLLFNSSVFSFLYLIDGLLTRILAVGFNIDPTRTNLTWCRSRTYIGQACSLIAVTFVCYAWIDQYFLTNQKEFYRRLSDIKRTRIVSLIIILFWFICMLPFAILPTHISFGNQTAICNVYANLQFNKYFSYFHQPIVASVFPIGFIIVIGMLIHQNIKLLKLNPRRQRVQRNLLSMIFVQTIFIIIQTIPYGFVSMYLVITLFQSKSLHRLAIESVLLDISSIFYYFTPSFSYLIYFISSFVYRQQVKLLIYKILHIQTNRVNVRGVPFIQS